MATETTEKALTRHLKRATAETATFNGRAFATALDLVTYLVAEGWAPYTVRRGAPTGPLVPVMRRDGRNVVRACKSFRAAVTFALLGGTLPDKPQLA